LILYIALAASAAVIASGENYSVENVPLERGAGGDAPSDQSLSGGAIAAIVVAAVVGCMFLAIAISLVVGGKFFDTPDVASSAEAVSTERRASAISEDAENLGNTVMRGSSYFFDVETGLWSTNGLTDSGPVSSVGRMFYRTLEEECVR
jgi:hypothetical protein